MSIEAENWRALKRSRTGTSDRRLPSRWERWPQDPVNGSQPNRIPPCLGGQDAIPYRASVLLDACGSPSSYRSWNVGQTVNQDSKQAKNSRPVTTAVMPHQPRRIADHPLGILALAGNHALTGLIEQRLRVQRAPGDPPPPATPVLGGTGANGVVRLYHYGDLSSLAEFSSPPGYPRLTDYGQGISQSEAATYTGTPIGPKLKYKYELQIDQDYFDKNFRNTGTRKGYSEYTTAKGQKIPTTYFRQVETLTGAAGGGGTGGSLPGSGGGTPPISGGTQTPTKAKADGAPEVKLPQPKVETPPVGGAGTGATSTRLGVAAARLRTAGRFLAKAAPGLLLQAMLMAIFPPKVHIHNDNYDALSGQKIDPALQHALVEQAATFNKLAAADDPAQSIWATVTVESEYRVATSGGDLHIHLQDLRFIDMKVTNEYLLVEGSKFQVGAGAKASKKVTYSIPIFGPATSAS